MLNWLKQQWRNVTGLGQDAINWLSGIINAVYSFIDHEINMVVGSLNGLINAFNSWTAAAVGWIVQYYNYAINFAQALFNNIISWAIGLVNQLWSYVTGLAAWAIQWVDKIWSYITGIIAYILQWVITNIWDPIWNAIYTALNWVLNEGAWLWYMFTHPYELIKYLARFIGAAWLMIFRDVAAPFARWMAGNMIGLVPGLASVIEDMIAALF